MKNLSVKYLGLELKSPIIASSSSFTSNIESIVELESKGVGAVVLKSLFEEQIIGQITHESQYIDYPEAAGYLNTYIRDNNIEKYLELIRSVKERCSIPAIASICCIKGGDWVSFAKEIEGAGADAIELNIFYMPTSSEETSLELEKTYLKTAEIVAQAINIPVCVKLSNHFTNPVNIARELYFRGIKGVTMFNRMYDPDINIHNMTIGVSDIFSNENELRHPLRWIAMSSALQGEIDYSASTGVHSPEDAIKLLLAGASTVQICSLLYKKGIDQIQVINNALSEWMGVHNFSSINDFKGKLNYKNAHVNVAYERSQFMKYYSSHK